MNRLFYYLSKTDPKIINGNSTKAKYTQASFGMFVLFTGMIAFFSGTYAMKMALGSEDSSYVLAALGGLIYALIIMAFDREIVAAKNKKAIFIRIPLALMIGMIVAIPLELRILEGRINEQLADEKEVKNSPNLEKRKAEFQILNNKEASLQQRRDNLDKELIKWTGEMGEQLKGTSTHEPGPGSIYLNAKEQANSTEARLLRLEKEIADFNKTKPDKVAAINSQYVTETPIKSTDLLSRYIALQRLKKSSGDPAKEEQATATKLMSWALTLLIIFIELFPALMKLFKEETDYDHLIHAQTEMNLGIISIKTNHRLDEIEQNPGTFLKPDAIESIQKQMEL